MLKHTIIFLAHISFYIHPIDAETYMIFYKYLMTIPLLFPCNPHWLKFIQGDNFVWLVQNVSHRYKKYPMNIPFHQHIPVIFPAYPVFRYKHSILHPNWHTQQ